MKNIIKIIAVAALLCITAPYSYAQAGFEGVLAEIEANNPSLAAKRKLVHAESIDAKVGNSLENPEVEYAHTWGHPSELGKTGELTVTQSFDFPTLYADRNKLAKLKAQQYGYEYAAYRQQLLLEAQMLCIEIMALQEKDVYLRKLYDDASIVSELTERKNAAGDASVMDVNKAKFECVNAMNACKMNEVELASAEKRLIAMNGGKPVEAPWGNTGDIWVVPPYDTAVGRYRESYPELQAVMAELTVAGQEVKVSKSRSLPKITLGYKNEFSKGERFNGLVVGMSIPMFGNRNSVKSAKARNIYAEAELARAQSDIENTIAELYAREAILRSTVEQYDVLAGSDDTADMLSRSIHSGHITLVEYYAQLQPVYDIYLAMAGAKMEYRMVCAAINMIDL